MGRLEVVNRTRRAERTRWKFPAKVMQLVVWLEETMLWRGTPGMVIAVIDGSINSIVLLNFEIGCSKKSD